VCGCCVCAFPGSDFYKMRQPSLLLTCGLALLAVQCGASPQSFSFGTKIGGDADSAAFSSSHSLGRPLPISGVSASAMRTFEDFFSSNSFGSHQSQPRVQSQPRQQVDLLRNPSTVEINRSPPTTRRPATVATTRSPPTTRRRTTPATQRTTPRTSFRDISRFHVEPKEISRKTSVRNFVRTNSARLRGTGRRGNKQPNLSSRGRKQQPRRPQPVTRPFATTTHVPDVRQNLVGQSICATGVAGDACRTHLAVTAASCTSGFCKECQSCSTMSAEHWPKCCREHNFCCRDVGKACQTCDRTTINPFCKVAFGRCN